MKTQGKILPIIPPNHQCTAICKAESKFSESLVIKKGERIAVVAFSSTIPEFQGGTAVVIKRGEKKIALPADIFKYEISKDGVVTHDLYVSYPEQN
jgi:hypothetical protein